MKSSSIYQVETSYNSDTLVVRASESYKAFFSNLSLVYQSIENNLALKGWPTDGINYTALYRRIKERGVVTISIKLTGSPMLVIKVSKFTMNEPLESLGIDLAPAVD